MSVVQEFWKIFLYALTGYLALCFLLFVFQRKLLYLPSQTRFSEEDINRVVSDLKSKYRSRICQYFFRLVVFNQRYSKDLARRGIHQITITDIADFFINVRTPSWQHEGLGVRSAHDQWDPLIKKIWKIGDPEHAVDENVKVREVLDF